LVGGTVHLIIGRRNISKDKIMLRLKDNAWGGNLWSLDLKINNIFIY